MGLKATRRPGIRTEAIFLAVLTRQLGRQEPRRLHLQLLSRRLRGERAEDGQATTWEPYTSSGGASANTRSMMPHVREQCTRRICGGIVSCQRTTCDAGGDGCCRVGVHSRASDDNVWVTGSTDAVREAVRCYVEYVLVNNNVPAYTRVNLPAATTPIVRTAFSGGFSPVFLSCQQRRPRWGDSEPRHRCIPTVGRHDTSHFSCVMVAPSCPTSTS